MDTHTQNTPVMQKHLYAHSFVSFKESSPLPIGAYTDFVFSSTYANGAKSTFNVLVGLNNKDTHKYAVYTLSYNLGEDMNTYMHNL